jgi:hypothetical protein
MLMPDIFPIAKEFLIIQQSPFYFEFAIKFTKDIRYILLIGFKQMALNK